jgi:hypothetical protein
VIGALRKNYGISLDEYEALVKSQNGVCAICLRFPNANGVLHVDHDHETGRVRGLLCMSCNVAIGYLCDDLEIVSRLVKYLGGGAF